ncbi:hypothetical protein HIM_08439 [Hirsutella minnesotensis 3608]|uniref:Uncharacterized protein n=1 Tax=Hirsutella minnesotensis 3608 TaxID=1043627 RepID=A0A0F8A3P2_9HYPO|nr:hypothetical protein HIM_08439 [Hirsutella minnesotensis 3608]
MARFRVPPVKGDCTSHDSRFRRDFFDNLYRDDPSCPEEGYIRALQLYGNEANLIASLKKTGNRFVAWRRDNPEDHDALVLRAKERGYDPDLGQVRDGWYESPGDVPQGVREESHETDSIVLGTPLAETTAAAERSRRHERDFARNPQYVDELSPSNFSSDDMSLEDAPTDSEFCQDYTRKLNERLTKCPGMDGGDCARIAELAENLLQSSTEAGFGERTADHQLIDDMMTAATDPRSLGQRNGQSAREDKDVTRTARLPILTEPRLHPSSRDGPRSSKIIDSNTMPPRSAFSVSATSRKRSRDQDEDPLSPDASPASKKRAVASRSRLDRLIRSAQPISMTPFIVRQLTQTSETAPAIHVFVLYVGNEALVFASREVALIWANWVSRMQTESGSMLPLNVLVELGGIPQRYLVRLDTTIHVIHSKDFGAVTDVIRGVKCFVSRKAATRTTAQILRHFRQFGFDNAEPCPSTLPEAAPGEFAVDTQQTDAWLTSSGRLSAIKRVEIAGDNEAGIPILEEKDLYSRNSRELSVADTDSSGEDAFGISNNVEA